MARVTVGPAMTDRQPLAPFRQAGRLVAGVFARSTEWLQSETSDGGVPPTETRRLPKPRRSSRSRRRRATV